VKNNLLDERKRVKIGRENKLSIVAVDLFCGVGGLTHGLIKSGISVRAGVDLDESCKYAFEKNNKAEFIHKNIKEFGTKDLNRLYRNGDIKVIVGCAPCQPFSRHTQKEKNRETKEDWGLLYHFFEIINKVNPIVISMENVPQIVKHKVFSDFVDGLKSKNYHVTWQKVYCPNYGIPQKRTRLVLLASKLGEIKLMDPTHSPENYKTVKMAIGNLEPIKAGSSSENDRLHKSAGLLNINLERIKKSVPGGSWRDWEENLRANCHRKRSGETYSSVYARMKWNKPSPTITTQFFSFGTGRFGHPEQNRAISIREGAILQTFPRKYRFAPPDSPLELKILGRHIGNAVPVRLGEIIGKSIIKHFKEYYE
jgi:DNA (cytosine-5)-methyltransferase 1